MMFATNVFCWIFFLSLASAEEIRFQQEQRNDQDEHHPTDQRVHGVRRNPKWSHFFVMHESNNAESNRPNGFFYQVGEGPTVVNRIRSFHRTSSNDRHDGRTQHSQQDRFGLNRHQSYLRNQGNNNQHQFSFRNSGNENYPNHVNFKNTGPIRNQHPQTVNGQFLERNPQDVSDPRYKIFTNLPHNVNVLGTNARPGNDQVLFAITLNEGQNEGSQLGVVPNGSDSNHANGGQLSLANKLNFPLGIKTGLTHNTRINLPSGIPGELTLSVGNKTESKNVVTNGGNNNRDAFLHLQKGSHGEHSFNGPRERDFGTNFPFPSRTFTLLPIDADSGIRQPLDVKILQDTFTGINQVTAGGKQNDDSVSKSTVVMTNEEASPSAGSIGEKSKVIENTTETLSDNITQNRDNRKFQNDTEIGKVSEKATETNVSSAVNSLSIASEVSQNGIEHRKVLEKAAVNSSIASQVGLKSSNPPFLRDDNRERENADIYRFLNIPGRLSNGEEAKARPISPSNQPHTSIQIYPSGYQSQLPSGANVKYDTNIHIHSNPTANPNQFGNFEQNKYPSHSIRLQPNTFQRPESKSVDASTSQHQEHPGFPADRNPIRQVYVLYPIKTFDTEPTPEHGGREIPPSSNERLPHRSSHLSVIHPLSLLTADRQLEDQSRTDDSTDGNTQTYINPDFNSHLTRQAVFEQDPKTRVDDDNYPGVYPISHQFNIPSGLDHRSQGYIDTRLQLPPLNFRFHITPVPDNGGPENLRKNNFGPRTNKPVHSINIFRRPIPYQKHLPSLEPEHQEVHISNHFGTGEPLLNHDNLNITLTEPLEGEMGKSISPLMKGEKNTERSNMTMTQQSQRDDVEIKEKKLSDETSGKSNSTLEKLPHIEDLDSVRVQKGDVLVMNDDIEEMSEIPSTSSKAEMTTTVSPSILRTTSGSGTDKTKILEDESPSTIFTNSNEPNPTESSVSEEKLTSANDIRNDAPNTIKDGSTTPTNDFTLNAEDDTTVLHISSTNAATEDKTPATTTINEVNDTSSKIIDNLNALSSTTVNEVGDTGTTIMSTFQDDSNGQSSTTVETDTTTEAVHTVPKITEGEILSVTTSVEPSDNDVNSASTAADPVTTAEVTFDISVLSTTTGVTDRGTPSSGDFESDTSTSTSSPKPMIPTRDKNSKKGLTGQLDEADRMSVLIFSEISNPEKILETNKIKNKNVDMIHRSNGTLEIIESQREKHSTASNGLKSETNDTGKSNTDLVTTFRGEEMDDVPLKTNIPVSYIENSRDEMAKTTQATSSREINLEESNTKGLRNRKLKDYSTYTFVEGEDLRLEGQVSKSSFSNSVKSSQNKVETNITSNSSSQLNFTLISSVDPNPNATHAIDLSIFQNEEKLTDSLHDATVRPSSTFEIFNDSNKANHKGITIVNNDSVEISGLDPLASNSSNIHDDSNSGATDLPSTQSSDAGNSLITFQESADRKINLDNEKKRLANIVSSVTNEETSHTNEKDLDTVRTAIVLDPASHGTTPSSIVSLEKDGMLTSVNGDEDSEVNGDKAETENANTKKTSDIQNTKENTFLENSRGPFEGLTGSDEAYDQTESQTLSSEFMMIQTENSKPISTMSNKDEETVQAENTSPGNFTASTSNRTAVQTTPGNFFKDTEQQKLYDSFDFKPFL